jgi:hypothetical protein
VFWVRPNVTDALEDHSDTVASRRPGTHPIPVRQRRRYPIVTMQTSRPGSMPDARIARTPDQPSQSPPAPGRCLSRMSSLIPSRRDQSVALGSAPGQFRV